MRLTLRTLLAYLDDVLEPVHAREIGDKINESALATQLVARIRDVIRRRRLGAPAVSGASSGIDPNTVAEYLDNSLTPEAVVDVEKVCLDSDVNLAEVSACHQVLTLVVSEPVEISAASRERMYALGPVPGEKAGMAAMVAALATSPPPEPAASVVEPAASVPAEQAAPARPAPQASFASTLPEYLQPAARPAWRTLVPAAVVLLVLVGWAFGIWYFVNQSQPTLVQADPPAQPLIAPDDQAAATPIVELEAPAPKQPTEPSPEPVLPMDGIDPPPPPDLPEEAPAVARVPEKPVVPEAPMPEKRVPEPAPAEPVDKPVKPAAPILPVASYDSREGVVLILNPADQHWYPLDRRVPIDAGDLLAVPAPFDGVFNFDDRRGQILVLENSVVRALGPNDATDWGWSLDRGRMVIRLTTPDARQRKLGLEVRGGLWGLELMTDDTVVGIEIDPREPDQYEQVFAPGEGFYGTLFVDSGSLRVVDSSAKETIVRAGNWLALNAVTPEPAGSPAWIHGVARSNVAKSYAVLFEKELVGMDPAAAPAADQLVGAVAKSPKPMLARFAVECLGLMSAVDQLVDALKNEQHEEARLAAIQAIREWLPVQPENKDRLLVELQKRFTPANVEIVYRLLWGYSAADLSDQAISERLVGWLEHEEIAVRELAFHYIHAITGKRNNYRPNATIGQRQEAVRTWKAVISKGPLVPPEPAPAAPTDPGMANRDDVRRRTR